MPSDATPAYRGYRLQALYALWRILESDGSEHLVFQPEGPEKKNVAKKLAEHKNLSEKDINNLLTKIHPVTWPGQKAPAL